MNKKKLICAFVGIIMLAVYVAVLVYLHQNYNEKRWIPKIILNIPNIAYRESFASKTKNVDSIVLSEVVPPSQNTVEFQVFFDHSPLPEIQMLRPWEKEKKALKTYARPVFFESKPKLAILLTDVGLDEHLFTEATQKLPPIISLSFSPYALNLTDKINYVRHQGFENMFDIVVESQNAFDNGGQYSIQATQSVEKIKQILQSAYFDLKVPFIGFWINNQIPVDKSVWQEVVQQKIIPHGLGIISSNETEQIEQNNLYSSAIVTVLEKAKTKAIEQGNAILSVPMHPIVVKTLIDWVGTQEHENISFVPVSSLMDKNLQITNNH